MEEVEVPSYFLCPISLQTMRDPVTLMTGITYDRESIERWIFSRNHSSCPVTKQPLPDSDLTPNHTLRRLIQAWCIANASNGIERFPTPKPPVDKAQIAKLLDDAKMSQTQMTSLRKLRSIVLESERNKRCVENSGAVDFLVSIIRKNISSNSREGELGSTDEALNILYSLQISESRLLDLITKNGDFIESLTAVLEQSNDQSRAYATLLLKSILAVVAPPGLMGLREELFQGLVNVLRDRISYQASKAALQIIGEVCPWGRNRIRAVDAGAVLVLIKILLEEPEKRECEMILMVLDQLCRCAEGRAGVLGHGAGIAVVSKKMLRVSQVASERAVRILYLVSKFSATASVLQEMLQVGAVSKLCLVLQVDCGVKTKEKVREILRLHSRTWKNSPCISPQFQSLYPSC